jgi:hypothetical protein
MPGEFLPDGMIREIEALNQLGAGLDENAEKAARKMAFLPAVKDREFVSKVRECI